MDGGLWVGRISQWNETTFVASLELLRKVNLKDFSKS